MMHPIGISFPAVPIVGLALVIVFGRCLQYCA